MPKQHAAKLYSRPDSSVQWLRYYEAGKLQRRSTGTSDPVLAQQALERHLDEHAAKEGMRKILIPVRDGFAAFERTLDGAKLYRFRRALPVLLEICEGHDIVTFQDLSQVTMPEIFAWLEEVELSGDATAKGTDGAPVYCGTFHLDQESIYEGFVFVGSAFEYLVGRPG